MSYWLISVPNERQTEKAVLETCERSTRGLAKCHLVRVPVLKVGTLDSLMALSDELAKQDGQVGQVARKMEKTYFDLSKSVDGGEEAKRDERQSEKEKKAAESESLKIGHLTAREYVEKFSWNETRYPKRSPLRTLTELIVKEANKSDEALKKQMAEYNEIRQTYAAIERRDTGSLLVRSMAPFIKEKDLIEKGHLTTFVLVVPRTKMEEFEKGYETMEDAQKEKEEAERQRKMDDLKTRAEELKRRSALLESKELLDSKVESKEEMDDVEENHKKEVEQQAVKDSVALELQKLKALQEVKALPCRIVVPRSSKKLFDDGKDEFVVYRIVLMKDGAETIRNVCRERRYVIRPYKHDPSEEKAEAEKKTELAKKRKGLWSYLLRWCSTTFAEVFAAWIHLKCIRLFVESVLRYGLPVSFTAILLEPQPRKDKKLREELNTLYARLGGGQAATSSVDEPDISGLTTGEFYSYCYIPLSLVD